MLQILTKLRGKTLSVMFFLDPYFCYNVKTPPLNHFTHSSEQLEAPKLNSVWQLVCLMGGKLHSVISCWILTQTDPVFLSGIIYNYK